MATVTKIYDASSVAQRMLSRRQELLGKLTSAVDGVGKLYTNLLELSATTDLQLDVALDPAPTRLRSERITGRDSWSVHRIGNGCPEHRRAIRFARPAVTTWQAGGHRSAARVGGDGSGEHGRHHETGRSHRGKAGQEAGAA